MAMTEKRARDMKRDAIAQTVYELIEQLGEEVMWTKSNELCFPCVDELGNEQFARITISIPTGSKGRIFPLSIRSPSEWCIKFFIYFYF